MPKQTDTAALPWAGQVASTYYKTKYRAEAIESAFARDDQWHEYIVLGDASADETPGALKHFHGKLHRERHDNTGRARTLNRSPALGRMSLIGYPRPDDLLDLASAHADRP